MLVSLAVNQFCSLCYITFILYINFACFLSTRIECDCQCFKFIQYRGVCVQWALFLYIKKAEFHDNLNKLSFFFQDIKPFGYSFEEADDQAYGF